MERQLTQKERNDLSILLGKAILDLRRFARSGGGGLAYKFADGFHNLPFLIASDRPVQTMQLVEDLDLVDGDGKVWGRYALEAAHILGITLPDKFQATSPLH